eukprot:COSAG05_NODE_18576_length_306_cov_0.908213_1_plen_101_part_11
MSPAVGGKTTFIAKMLGDDTWKVLLPRTQKGGRHYSATAACAKCQDTTATTIRNLTFGDARALTNLVVHRGPASVCVSVPQRALRQPPSLVFDVLSVGSTG